MILKAVEPTTEPEQKEFAQVKYNERKKGQALYALRTFKSGDIISPFSADETFSTPNYLTVQLAKHHHISLLPKFLQYINHSCDPNIFFDTTKMVLQALKPIKVGDEFTFFYPSTEWDMAQAFECRCGGDNCLYKIQGAKYIAPEILKNYRLTEFILNKLSAISNQFSPNN